jgi:hypothetical protein
VFKHYQKLLDNLDDLMIALNKQKHLGLDPEVINALKELTKSRNIFKRQFIKEMNKPVTARDNTVFNHLLDNVSDEMI